MQIHPQQSPDETICGNTAPVQQVKLSPPNGRDLFWGTILALSIVMNVWCLYTIRDYGTERRLEQYNLGFFIDHDFAELKSKVIVDHELIQAYGLQSTVENSYGGRRNDHHPKRGGTRPE